MKDEPGVSIGNMDGDTRVEDRRRCDCFKRTASDVGENRTFRTARFSRIGFDRDDDNGDI